MIVLPKNKILEGYTLEKIRFLLYGPPGIGKTTFSSKFDNTIFLETEKGSKGLKTYKISIHSWEDFIETVNVLVGDKHHKFKTVTIDTITNLFTFCLDYSCKKLSIGHPSDEKWGKGWERLRTEFSKPILKLNMSDFGLIFIAHSIEQEVKKGSRTFTKVAPELPNQARRVLLPFVDIIGYVSMEAYEVGNTWKERRVITFEPSQYVEAKKRTGIPLPDTMNLNYRLFSRLFKKS